MGVRAVGTCFMLSMMVCLNLQVYMERAFYFPLFCTTGRKLRMPFSYSIPEQQVRVFLFSLPAFTTHDLLSLSLSSTYTHALTSFGSLSLSPTYASTSILNLSHSHSHSRFNLLFESLFLSF